MENTSNVSRRFKQIRTALKLTCRAFDRAARRAEGTCAIIEARDTDDITRPVAESYAAAAKVDVAWLMLGLGKEPDWSTLTTNARPVGADHTASDFTVADTDPTGPVIIREGFDQRTGTEG